MKGDKDATRSSSVIVNVKQAIIMYSNLHQDRKKKKLYRSLTERRNL